MKSTRSMKFRRRREAITNYKRRIELVKSGLDRVVVRKTNKRILSQVARYTEKGDIILAQANSNELAKFNWPRKVKPCQLHILQDCFLQRSTRMREKQTTYLT